MFTLKITAIGNSAGVILPKELLARLKVGKGDKLIVTESEDGVRIQPFDPEFEDQVKAGEGFMRKYRNALRELAK